MSVELTGPKGYEIQYLITVWIALLAELRSPKTASVKVEQQEDAEILIKVDGADIFIALQSKYQKGDLTLPTLASWLAHFPAGTHENSLADRLLDNKSQIALFVTRSRCTDDTHTLLMPHGVLKEHKKPPLKQQDLNTLAKEIDKLFKPKNNNSPSKLSVRRSHQCNKIASRVKGDPAAFTRVIIWEQIEEQLLFNLIAETLTSFSIPASKSEYVLTLLIEATRSARDNRGELMDSARIIIQRHHAARILRTPFHTTRPEEHFLSESLNEEKTLFLTGRGLSGKTHIGRVLLQKLQDSGFECTETDDVKSARNFLTPRDAYPRAVLLDDPLTLAEKPLDSWKAISDLRENLPDHHRLVVTSKTELLMGIYSQFTANETDIFGCFWHDVTSFDRSFLKEYWAKLCEEKDISSRESELIARHLEEEESNELLQPGQIRHLAHCSKKELEGKSTVQLLHIARFNSQQIASELSGEEIDLILALGVGACTRAGMSTDEIQFLLDSSSFGQDFEDKSLRPITFGKLSKQEDSLLQFPTYTPHPKVGPAWLKQLKRMEQRGYIEIQDKIFFNHPDYREAFQRRVFLQKGTGVQDAIDLIARSFRCLDPEVGISAARLIMTWLPKFKPAQIGHMHKLIEVALEATEKSIFPDVQTTLGLCLLKNANLLKRDQEHQLLSLIRHTDAETRTILWHGNTPWFDKRNWRWLEEKARNQRRSSTSKLEETSFYLNSIDTASSVSGPEADALNSFYLTSSTATPDPKALFNLLSRPEVFIRADTAHIVASPPFLHQQNILNAVFSDEHPMVTARFIATSFSFWNHLKEPERGNIENRILIALSELGIAALSTPLLSLGDAHGTHHLNWENFSQQLKEEMWDFWIDIASAILSTLSSKNIFINFSRVYNSTEIAQNYVGPEKTMKLLRAWLSWIESQPEDFHFDDYSTVISDIALETTSNAPHLRGDIFQRLLNLSKTEPVILNLGILVSRWDELMAEEKDTIVQTISSSRADILWLRATVLIRGINYVALPEIIVGKPDFYNLPTNDQVQILDRQLMERCLLLSSPNLGIFFKSEAEDTWNNILINQAHEPNSTQFHLAISQIIYKAAMRRKDYENYKKTWSEICETAPLDAKIIMFTELLNCSINYTGSKLGEFWEIFWCKLDPKFNQQEIFLDEIMENLEGLSCTCNYGTELYDLIGKDLFTSRILPQCPTDGFCLVTSRIKSVTEDMAESISEIIEAIYSKYPSRILSHHDVLTEWIDDFPWESFNKTKNFLNVHRDKLVTEGFKQQKNRKMFRPCITDWQ